MIPNDPRGRVAGSRAAVSHAAAARAAMLLGLWVVLIGPAPADLAAGIVTAAGATWLSLRVHPPGATGVRLRGLPALAVRFLWHSLVAAFDVARRVLDPGLPVQPGLAAHPVALPPGLHREVFAALTSLSPGTVVLAETADEFLLHCLDVDQPVSARLRADEAALARVLRGPLP